ncbi:MAG: putative photosynthetic complex assembly protein PuhE [Dinoroseobacter sp.]|nr:putative photosynthetic complex assembly protein PuhE [Dinoroseobacter sp.]
MFANPWIVALCAMFVWWFATGAILWIVKNADHRGPNAHARSVVLTAPLGLLGVYGFSATTGLETLSGIWIAFGSALLIWGWIEHAFLSGVITGPNSYACPENCSEFERFFRAWGTIAYHEMLLLTVVIAMALSTWDAPNQFGLWTFAILFVARISAKLNLFLGVRKINTEFLPAPLAHLPSHFHIAPMNWLFPYSVTALTFAMTCWFERLFTAETPAETAGFTLLAVFTALALLEHWLMVVPLPDEKLWRWLMPSAKEKRG